MREMLQIWEAIKDLRRRVTQRPVPILPRLTYKSIYIDQGNTLEEGSDGILYEATVASVPSAYDPNVTSSFVDGIGRGTLYINGVAQTGYVLVVNSDSGTFRNALVQGDAVWVGDPVQIPVDGGGYVAAYPVM